MAAGERPEKKGLHPRNRHRERYDFKRLGEIAPDLRLHVTVNRYGDESIDFADPDAVKALNRALLKEAYAIEHWDIPQGYLCPPIPGRVDYIHHVADVLSDSGGGEIPRGPSIRVLDIGVGANCIYPIIGHGEYGWSFVGVDIDAQAIASARKIIQGNSDLEASVELRLQKSSQHVFSGLLDPNETFDVSICNPPFHSSREEAEQGSIRKWKGLRKTSASSSSPKSPKLNFGGQAKELWCDGGELAFVSRMIDESTQIKQRCRWFTSLLSKGENLPDVLAALKRAKPKAFRVIDMMHGQKKSRIVAWTFFTGVRQ